MWIHGGGFLSGDGRPESFGPQYLVSASKRKHDLRSQMFIWFFITFMGHDYKHHARSCFMSFYLRSDLGDQFRVHVRWRLGLWWWQSTTDSPHSVSSGAEKKKQLQRMPISFLLVAVSLQSHPQPGHWRGAWKYGDAGPGPLCFILQEAVNRYKTRLLRYVGFRRTSHLLEATLPRWQTVK